MKKFDTNVQYLKYQVLREVARHSWDDDLAEHVLDIPKTIIPGTKPTLRCCVYKERAILGERVKLAMGGNKSNPNVIEVLPIACDECPMGGYEVTTSCRGCIAHRCYDACKKKAISYDENHTAHIDKDKCVNCGLCAKACPYSAIINRRRPCENACKIHAIGVAEDKSALIDNEKCISCGACVYQCPFGAIQDKSFILNAIDIIKKSDNNKNYKVLALVAPSIASQFSFAKLGQVVRGLKELGFAQVVEVALGADMVAFEESRELAEKGFLTSSCCPAFVSYVEKNFENLKPYMSSNPSPMVALAKYIKAKEPTAKLIFIGPCTAKKAEARREENKPYIDAVLTFEELQALYDSRDIDIMTLDEDELDDASYYGRIFARSGGLSDAVAQGLKEHGIEDFHLKAVPCDGIEECRVALLKKSKNILDGNFIEGMACVNGCIGGAGCLTHGEKNKSEVDKYGMQASDKTITDAVSVL